MKGARLEDFISMAAIVNNCALTSCKPITDDDGNLVKFVMEFVPKEGNCIDETPTKANLKGVFKSNETGRS